MVSTEFGSISSATLAENCAESAMIAIPQMTATKVTIHIGSPRQPPHRDGACPACCHGGDSHGSSPRSGRRKPPLARRQARQRQIQRHLPLRGCLNKARVPEGGVIQAVNVKHFDTQPYGGH